MAQSAALENARRGDSTPAGIAQAITKEALRPKLRFMHPVRDSLRSGTHLLWRGAGQVEQQRGPPTEARAQVFNAGIAAVIARLLDQAFRFLKEVDVTIMPKGDRSESRARSLPDRKVERARIVLLAAEGGRTSLLTLNAYRLARWSDVKPGPVASAPGMGRRYCARCVTSAMPNSYRVVQYSGLCDASAICPTTSRKTLSLGAKVMPFFT